MGGGAQSKSQKAQDYLDNIEEYPFHEGRPSFIITQPHPAEALANADLNQSSVQKTKKPVINGPRHDPLSLAAFIASNYKEGNVPGFIEPNEDEESQESEPPPDDNNHFQNPNHMKQSQNSQHPQSNAISKYYPNQVHHEANGEYEDEDYEETIYPYNNSGNNPPMQNERMPYGTGNQNAYYNGADPNHQSHIPSHQFNQPQYLNDFNQNQNKFPQQSHPQGISMNQKQQQPTHFFSEEDYEEQQQQQPRQIKVVQQQNLQPIPENIQPVQPIVENQQQPAQMNVNQTPMKETTCEVTAKPQVNHIQPKESKLIVPQPQEQQQNSQPIQSNPKPVQQTHSIPLSPIQTQPKQSTTSQQGNPTQPKENKQSSPLQSPQDKPNAIQQYPQNNIRDSLFQLQNPSAINANPQRNDSSNMKDSNPNKKTLTPNPSQEQPKYNILEPSLKTQLAKPIQPSLSRGNSNEDGARSPSNIKPQVDPFKPQPRFQKTLNPLSFAPDKTPYKPQNMETPYRSFSEHAVPQSFGNYHTQALSHSPTLTTPTRPVNPIYNHAKNLSFNHADSNPNPKEGVGHFSPAKPETHFYNPRYHPDYDPENLPSLIVGSRNRNAHRRLFGNDNSVVHPLTQKVGSKAASVGPSQRGNPENAQAWYKGNTNQPIRDASPLLKPATRNLTPIGSSSKEHEQATGRRPQPPEDYQARNFKNSPYQHFFPSQEIQEPDNHNPQEPIGNYFYGSLARGEFHRRGPPPRTYKDPRNPYEDSPGNSQPRHITASFDQPVDQKSGNFKPVSAIPDDHQQSPQSITPRAIQSDHLPNGNQKYSEYYANIDNQDDHISLDPVNTWRKQINPHQLPNIHSKPVSNTYSPNLTFDKAGHNPILKNSVEKQQRSRSVVPSSKTSSPLDHDPFQQTFSKPENVEPLKSSKNSNFNFNSCILLLTSDATLEHLKSGKSLDLVFNKVKIPNNRMKGRIIKKIYEMNNERSEYLRQPIQIRALCRRFLHNAKLFLNEPIYYFEDFLDEQSPMRLDLHCILTVLLEFFHFMGFFLQHEKVFNYLDRWWRALKDDDYLSGLTDRLEQDALNLKQDLEENLLKRKRQEDTQFEQAWNSKKVWTGREVKVAATTKLYLNNLYSYMIQKKSLIKQTFSNYFSTSTA